MGSAGSLRSRAVIALALMVGFYALALSMVAVLLWIPYATAVHLRVNAISVKLGIFCLIGAVIILKAVVPRPDHFTPPGPHLAPDRHSRLFAEIRRTADSVGQPMPAEVYLVPDVNAWVSQRGGVLGIGGRRIMGIGLALLNVLKVPEFKAVIAHEFGHYHGGDVKLGPLIYKTREALVRTVLGLAQHSGLMTKPFEWYARLFFRVSHAVSRHQERQADALAAGIAGAPALARGLIATHRAALAFPVYWLNEIGPVLDAGFLPPFGPGFARFCQESRVAVGMARATEAAMKDGEADPYDTHPSLRERLAAVGQPEPEPASASDPPAVTLLDSLEELEGLLLARVAEGKILRPLAWDDVGTTVLLPRWRGFVKEHGHALRGVTPAAIPRLDWGAVGRALALSTKQEEEQEEGVEHFAEYTIGAALAVLLARRGFSLHAPPGVSPALKQGALSVEPFELRARFATGAAAVEEWRRLCSEIGIAEVDLSREAAN